MASETRHGAKLARQVLLREISRRQALKVGGLAAMGVAFSKPLIETIKPKPAFGQGYGGEPTPEPPMCLETKLTASDGVAGDNFGIVAAMSGDTAIVGPFNRDAAYIFRRDEGGTNNWGEVKKLIGFDTLSGDFFGGSVAISGGIAIVGARSDDDAGSSSGSAYIFRRDEGGTDNWGEVKKLVASDAAAGDGFGGSERGAAISGDTAIVGAALNDDAGDDSGSAYIFRQDEGGTDNWGEVKKVTASDAAAGDFFGSTVAISGDTAMVGALLNDDAGSNSGSAYIFRQDEGGTDNWGEVKKLTAAAAAAGDIFGSTVAISGDIAIVGASDTDEAGSASGSAYIFGRNEGGTDNWGEVKKLTASAAASAARFGRAVGISGDTVVVGANGDESAYIYQNVV